MNRTEKQDRTTMARQRSDIYGILAIIYRQEVTSDFIEQTKDPQLAGILSELGVEMTRNFYERPEKELLDDLAVEYARLFLGPGRHISPHESVHHQRDSGHWGRLWGTATVEAKQIIESTSLTYTDEYKALPDHIAVELEFMQKVTLREEQAWREADADSVASCRQIEKEFIEKHLNRWIPAFCEKVMMEAQLPFYRELAGLTKKFIVFETEEMNGNGRYVG